MIVLCSELKLYDVFSWTAGVDLFTVISTPQDEFDPHLGRTKIRFRIFHPRFLKTYPMVVFPEEEVRLIE